MIRRTSMLAAMTSAVAGLAMVAATGASASPPTLQPAQQRCEAAGGTFFVPPEIGLAPPVLYLCALPVPEPGQAELGGTQAICEHAYGGTYFFLPLGTIGPPAYICVAV